MGKAFTEKEFQTNQNVWVETVNYKSLMGVQVFSVPTEVINLYGKLQIWKYRHYGGQAVWTNGAILSNSKRKRLFFVVRC